MDWVKKGGGGAVMLVGGWFIINIEGTALHYNVLHCTAWPEAPSWHLVSVKIHREEVKRIYLEQHRLQPSPKKCFQISTLELKFYTLEKPWISDKKSGIWETSNLSTDADRRTDTILESLRDLSRKKKMK